MLDEIVLNETLKEESVPLELKDLYQTVIQLRKLRRKYSDPLHQKELQVYEELAESLFELRASKEIEGIEIKGFDSSFLEIIRKMKEIYVKFITGKYYTKDDKILCVTKTQLARNGKILQPGDLVLLPLKEVLALITSDYITPLEVE